jgi:hypothetical protein
MWRQTVFQKWISDDKYTVFTLKFRQSGDSKAFVTTNVTTEIIWLDTTALNAEQSCYYYSARHLMRSRLIE